MVPDTQGVRVLVADDDPGVRTSVAAALRREGYTVELASDGMEALERLGGGPFDCVVLDVLMPWLDGLTRTEFALLELFMAHPGAGAYAVGHPRAGVGV
jgi:DNA-binding response OmpR family regulator